MQLSRQERHVLLQSLRDDAADSHDATTHACGLGSWERIFHAAAQLGIAPLLYTRLVRAASLAHVGTVLTERKRDLLWSQAHNMKRFAKLRPILAALRANGIPVIPLKGAALAELVYGHIGLRTMGDVDLLVHKEDLGRVETLLEDIGFHADESYRPRAWYRTHHHHIVPYVSPDHLLTLEVHHNISLATSRVRVPVSELWTHAQGVHIASVPCTALSWEHMLLHLALHISDQNCFYRDIRGLCDVTEVVKRYSRSIDWDLLLRSAYMIGAQTHLYFTLSLSKDLLGGAIPQDALSALRRQTALRPCEERILRSLFRRAVLIVDMSEHWIDDWALSDFTRDLLNQRSPSESVNDITQKAMRRLALRFASMGA